MYRFSTSCLGLAVLIAFACGAPAELDESLFPDTYTGDDQTGSAGSNGLPQAGTGNISAGGVGGAAPPGTAGTSASVGGAGAPAGAGSGGGGVAAGGGATNADGCPTDISVLLNRPIAQGGCAGGLCHQPGGVPPDLISPDPLSRLLNVPSANCNGMPYIGATVENSLIGLKITTPPPNCGIAMPFLMQEALSAKDEACILAWVADNAGG